MAPTKRKRSDEKACRRCGTTKPASEFNKNRAARDGLQTYCRSCARAYELAKKTPHGGPRGSVRGTREDTVTRLAVARRIANERPLISARELISLVKAETGRGIHHSLARARIKEARRLRPIVEADADGDIPCARCNQPRPAASYRTHYTGSRITVCKVCEGAAIASAKAGRPPRPTTELALVNQALVASAGPEPVQADISGLNGMARAIASLKSKMRRSHCTRITLDLAADTCDMEWQKREVFKLSLLGDGE